MIERRKEQRNQVRQGAFIFAGADMPSIPCLMLDLSAAGARIMLDPAVELPEEFILVLSRDKRLNRRCQIAWRNDDQLGLRFISQHSIVAPRRSKANAATEAPHEEPHGEIGGEAATQRDSTPGTTAADAAESEHLVEATD